MDLTQELQVALRHLQNGQIAQAEQICRNILHFQASQPDALYLLGAMALQAGDNRTAIDLIGKATGFRPLDPYCQYNLGLALQREGRLSEALTCYREAVRLQPDWVEAIDNLGIVLQQQGDLDAAVACYRKVLLLCPEHIGTHNNLGLALHEKGLLDEAIGCYRNLISLNPTDAEAHSNLGNVLKEQGRLNEAEACYRAALALQPSFANAHNNLGLALQQQGRLEEAVVCYHTALTLRPDLANAHNCLGLVLQQQGHVDAAIASYRQALTLQADFANAQWNLALALLLNGDYQVGLAYYEKRFDGGAGNDFAGSRALLAELAGTARWQGESLRDKTLLLWTEQGLGDSLMMSRYLPKLAEKGVRRLLVYCDPALLPVFEALPLACETISQKEPLPQGLVDYHCPMMSLPYLFGTRLETLPDVPPCLAVPAEMQRAWAQRLPAGAGMKVGLVWAGGAQSARDALRSLPLQKLAPLMRVAPVRFVSLQKGLPANQLTEVDWPILDCMDQCDDLLDSAALIANLDLVISVDTAVAHLAASLGKPVWLLNRFESEWRWLLLRQDSPWYPSVRLFRQPALHDWDSVITQIAEELAYFSCHGGLRPLQTAP